MTRQNRRQSAKERRAMQQLERDAADARKAFAKADAWARSSHGTRYGGTLETLQASGAQAPKTRGPQAPRRLSAGVEAPHV